MTDLRSIDDTWSSMGLEVPGLSHLSMMCTWDNNGERYSFYIIVKSLSRNALRKIPPHIL